MHRIVFMLTLVLAGELIFGLPFHTTRFFRPTFLEVFSFSNTQLGDVFAVYGITAMLAYFPGGVIADHYSPRTLMTLSLFATGIANTQTPDRIHRRADLIGGLHPGYIFCTHWRSNPG